MEIERQSLHRWHLLSNIASEIQGDQAEVECYGIATTTHDSQLLNILRVGI